MTASSPQDEIDRGRLDVEQNGLPESLGDFVRERARTLGDAIVGNWFEDNIKLTYRHLDEMSDRLASSLVERGVRKGAHVAVMLPNVAAFPVSWAAIGKIGAAMVPVNASYTAEELRFVLTDSDAQYLIIDASMLATYEEVSASIPLIAPARVIVHGNIDGGGYPSWTELSKAGEAPFLAPSTVSRHDLLNLQYTSGTTGFPKGCMLSHDYWMLIGKLASLMRNSGQSVKNTLIWAPFFYMDPMWQLLMTMNLGGTVHVARRMSLTKFYDWLRDHEINYCIFPEPALKAKEPSPEDRKLSLKYISIYGWRKEAREEVQNRFGVVAREGYGMTEIGGGTIMPVSAVEMALERSCGMRAAFRELRIVDEEGRDVPIGETGELWVAGRGILLGYYKRPEANTESFRGKWFRTGDVFRRDEAGYYYIVGRIKDMVKRGGENIAAAEVEAALRALDDIAEAAVVPVPDPVRREEVKAYLLLKDGLTKEDCPPEEVIEHCRARLAPFKIPRYIAYVTEFPRTPSRKIQKRAIIADVADLRIGAWDREEGKWR